GKTTHCLEEIREKLQAHPNDSPMIMLVPDQMTFQMEYRLEATPGLGGMSRAQVFSFARFALNVLAQTGGVARQHISSIGLNMMLRKITEHRKSELKVYGRASDQQGFYQILEEMITEFKRYCISPQDLLLNQENDISAEL